MVWDTNENLLRTLRENGGQAAWAQFFEKYAGPLHTYVLNLGLEPVAAEEVVQETMIEMMRIMPEFAYDPRRRFRNFLLTVAHRKALRELRGERRRRAAMEALAMHLERGNDSATLNEAFAEREWRLALFEEAWREYRGYTSMKAHLVEAFEAVVFHGEKPADVARRLGLSVDAVYQNKSRIIRGIKTHVNRLDAGLG